MACSTDFDIQVDTSGTASQPSPNINHEEGYKDDKKVVVREDSPWAPTNEELFQLIDLWFEAEEYEFGDGYGCLMPLFYVCLIALGHEEKAYEAYGKRGTEAVEHFDNAVEQHADEVIAAIESLR